MAVMSGFLDRGYNVTRAECSGRNGGSNEEADSSGRHAK